MEKDRCDIYERVTRQIIEAIEHEPGRFRLPWHRAAEESELPTNVVSKNAYRGVNALLLWANQQVKGYHSPVWGTYRQWQSLGAQVRRGEKATSIVFWNVKQGDDEEEGRKSSRAKSRRSLFTTDYAVFNADQVDNFVPTIPPELSVGERNAHAEGFFEALGADIRHGGTVAAYNVTKDCILLPRFELFRDRDAYYATLAHEVTHWTGAKTRLDRLLAGRADSENYAFEELIADLGAAFLAAHLKLNSEPKPEHAAYLATWLGRLKDDKRTIFAAASKAQAAADYAIRLAARRNAA